jgi:hypothetical protein
MRNERREWRTIHRAARLAVDGGTEEAADRLVDNGWSDKGRRHPRHRRWMVCQGRRRPPHVWWMVLPGIVVASPAGDEWWRQAARLPAPRVIDGVARGAAARLAGDGMVAPGGAVVRPAGG